MLDEFPEPDSYSRPPLTTRGQVIAWRALSRAGDAIPSLLHRLAGADLDRLRAVIAAEIDNACEMPPAIVPRGRPRRER